MEGAHLLIAVVALTALICQVNGLAGVQLAKTLEKTQLKQQCYVCHGCEDSSKHLSDDDLKPCLGKKMKPDELGLVEMNGKYEIATIRDNCTAEPVADQLACYIGVSGRLHIPLSDKTNLDKVKADYTSGVDKIIKEAGQILQTIGNKLLYFKPLCSIYFGTRKQVIGRGCEPNYLKGYTTPSTFGGECGDFKQVEKAGTTKPAWCSCDTDKCNGGSFTRPSVAVLVISAVLATFIYGRN